MLDYLKTANSLVLWLSCVPAILLVVVQAAIFMKRAWTTGPKLGVTKEQMKTGAKAAAVASIGPSIIVCSGAISLLASVGGPLTWLRLSFIGSVMYELPAAERAVQAAGCTLGSSNMTMEAFSNAAWIMTICALGWTLVAAFFTDKMEVVRDKVTGGKFAVMAALTAGGALGAFGYLVAQRFIPFKIGSANMWSAVVGFVVMWGINIIIKKTNAKWAKQFGISIAMFAGMAVGTFLL